MSEQNGTSSLVDEFAMKKIEDYLEKDGYQISKINVDAGSMKGDNYLGVIAKVTLDVKTKNGENKTLHWIVKSAPKNEEYRKMCSVDSCFVREIYIYHEVFSKYLSFQESKQVKNPYKNLIKVYLGSTEYCHEFIAMENMKELEFKMLDRFNPMDLETTRLVMKEYGRFHALSFAYKDQQPVEYQKLAENLKENFISKWVGDPVIEEVQTKNMDCAIASLDPSTDQEAIDKCNKLKTVLLDSLIESTKDGAAGEYAVINHGDCWLNNMLFKFGDKSKPNVATDVLFLDFQLSRVGSPVLDLSYFLCTCTDKQVRMHMDSLLDDYHESLSSFLTELGSDANVLYPRHILDQHLKKFTVFGFLMSGMVLPLMMTESEDVPEWTTMSVEEMKDSLDDALNPTYKDKFDKRMRDLILDLIDFKYL